MVTEDGTETGEAVELSNFYKPICDKDTRIEIGTWDEADIKIFYNTFITTKLCLVNMIQDCAMKVGNMNVDVVTKALKDSTMRIMGPSYMKANYDGGGCHPRDNIALRWFNHKSMILVMIFLIQLYKSENYKRKQWRSLW